MVYNAKKKTKQNKKKTKKQNEKQTNIKDWQQNTVYIFIIKALLSLLKYSIHIYIQKFRIILHLIGATDNNSAPTINNDPIILKYAGVSNEIA